MHCGPRGENRQRFSIYVLKLGPRHYYVGCTAKTLAERISEHRASGRKFKHARSLGQWCLTREKAEVLERRVAAELRRKGYEVEQG
jgi:predicted GIY-YIG superfamily endonuclease